MHTNCLIALTYNSYVVLFLLDYFREPLFVYSSIDFTILIIIITIIIVVIVIITNKLSL
jgi:hypothetical protein